MLVGVAWRTRKSVPTPGSESLQRRATQPCVSISSFKASISFLTTKHTARVRRPRPASYPPHRPVYEEPLLPPLPESLPFYFPYSSIFVCPLLPFLPTLSFPPPPSPVLFYRRPLRPDTDVRGSSTSAAGDIVRNVVARLSWLAAHLARVNFVRCPHRTSHLTRSRAWNEEYTRDMCAYIHIPMRERNFTTTNCATKDRRTNRNWNEFHRIGNATMLHNGDLHSSAVRRYGLCLPVR